MGKPSPIKPLILYMRPSWVKTPSRKPYLTIEEMAWKWPPHAREERVVTARLRTSCAQREQNANSQAAAQALSCSRTRPVQRPGCCTFVTVANGRDDRWPLSRQLGAAVGSPNGCTEPSGSVRPVWTDCADRADSKKSAPAAWPNGKSRWTRQLAPNFVEWAKFSPFKTIWFFAVFPPSFPSRNDD